MHFSQPDDDEWGGLDGYSAASLMSLVRELTGRTHAHRPDLAFLTSDMVVGAKGQHVPYSLVADGVWQDTFFEPEFWLGTIWPNIRDVSWSHHGRPAEGWDAIEFGVQHFGAPVSVCRGWLASEGFAGFDDSLRQKMVALFRQRGATPSSLKPLTELELAELRAKWTGFSW